MRLSAWVSFQFCLYCLGGSSITHGLIVCGQLTQACRWVSCLSRLSSFLSPVLVGCVSLVPCQSPSIELWVRLAPRECLGFGSGFTARFVAGPACCFLFSSLFSLFLCPASNLCVRLGSFSSSSRPLSSWLGRLSLPLCLVCLGAPCKSPNCDSNLF